MLSEEILDREDVCAVCGHKLELVYYKNSDGQYTQWLEYLKSKPEIWAINYELKRCSRCGLLYAK